MTAIRQSGRKLLKQIHAGFTLSSLLKLIRMEHLKSKKNCGNPRGHDLTAKLKRLWKNEYIQTIVSIGLVIAVTLGFIYGSQLLLNTNHFPFFVVSSGSMSIPASLNPNDGWLHPFDRTLHIGDVVLVQGVNPNDLNANYPYSDIIVYQEPSNPSELIIHRIVAKVEINGTLYFYTKGDGNSYTHWPSIPDKSEYDTWSPVPANLIVGRVVGRIPWFGYIALMVQSNFVVQLLLIVLILIIVIVEFVLPLRKNKKDTNKEKNPPVVTRFFNEQKCLNKNYQRKADLLRNTFNTG